MLTTLKIRVKHTKVVLDIFDEFRSLRGCDCIGRRIVGFVPDAYIHREVVGVELVDYGYVHLVQSVEIGGRTLASLCALLWRKVRSRLPFVMFCRLCQS